jgi:hypothetical protein
MSYKPVRASMSESQIEKWISRIRWAFIFKI